MKKITSIFCIVFAAYALALATGITTIAPVNVNTPNPTQGPFSFSSTNQFTNVVTFPIPYPTNIIPIVTVASSGTNAFTNVVTSTNVTISSGPATNVYFYTTTWPYTRIETGTIGFGAIVSGAVTYTNTYSPPFTTTPVLDIAAQGSLFATNSGAWVVTNSPTQFIIQTGNTNQIIQWGAIGQATSPGVNVPSN